MSENQVVGNGDQEAGDKGTKRTGKDEKQSGDSGTVLAEMNSALRRSLGFPASNQGIIIRLPLVRGEGVLTEISLLD